MNFKSKGKQLNLKTIFAFLFLIVISFCSMFCNPINVSAHDAYFLGITFDTDSCRYIGTVVFEENGWSGSSHAEAEISTEFYLLIRGEDTTQSQFNVDYGTTASADILTAWSFYDKDDFDNDRELLFTFPGFHTKGIATDALNADGSDEKLATRVCNTLIPQLNACINWIMQKSGQERTSDNVRDLSNNIAKTVKTTNDLSSSSGNVTVNGKTVSFETGLDNDDLPESVKEGIPKGFSSKDYVKVTIDGDEQYFIYQCWKGYQYPAYGGSENPDKSNADDGDPYARDVSQGDWYKDVCKGNGVYKIGWNAIILQAHFNLDVLNTGFSNMGEILPSSMLIEAIAGLCDWAITTIRSFLGLYELDDLMLNKGTRGSVYSMGLFPNAWVGPIMVLHVVCQIVAWSIMGFAIIKMLMKRQLATVNIGEKMNMMNELKNLAICGFLLGSFPLVFNMLARINITLVDLFGSTTQFSYLIGSFNTISQVSLGSILVSFFGLALSIYFNFFYVLRAITLAILYGIAPLCIYTLALGGKYSKVFGAWMKELLSNIFTQTIHAIMIAFFTSVIGGGGITSFEMCVVLYSFIPLTKFVKQNVFQAGDGIGGSAGALAGGAMGAAGAAAGAAKGGGGGSSHAPSSGGPSGGGNSKGGGAATGIAADRMAKAKDPSRGLTGNSLKDDAQLGNNTGVGGAIKNFAANHEKTAGAAEKVKNMADSSKGYSSGPTMTSLDGSKMGNPNLKSQTLARADGHLLGGARTRTAGIAKGIASSAAHVAGGAVMGAMALGVSSFDERAGSRMMSNAATHMGNGINGGYSAIKNNIGGDKDISRQLKSHGVSEIRDDGKNVYKTYDGISYDSKQQKLTGDGLARLSESEKTSLTNLARAQDKNSTMSDEERAHYNTFAAKNGIKLGSVEDKKTGGTNLAMSIDKNIATANGRQSDYVSYGHAAPTFSKKPQTASEKVADMKAQQELQKANTIQMGSQSIDTSNMQRTESGIVLPEGMRPPKTNVGDSSESSSTSPTNGGTSKPEIILDGGRGSGSSGSKPQIIIPNSGNNGAKPQIVTPNGGGTNPNPTPSPNPGPKPQPNPNNDMGDGSNRPMGGNNNPTPTPKPTPQPQQPLHNDMDDDDYYEKVNPKQKNGFEPSYRSEIVDADGYSVGGDETGSQKDIEAWLKMQEIERQQRGF